MGKHRKASRQGIVARKALVGAAAVGAAAVIFETSAGGSPAADMLSGPATQPIPKYVPAYGSMPARGLLPRTVPKPAVHKTAPAPHAAPPPPAAVQPAPASSTAPAPSYTQADKAVMFAHAQLGCPYVWGGTGPCSAGFDCSGLVMMAWAYAGVSIPRTSEEQEAELPHVPESEMAPGDLLVVLGGDHVGMYVGNGNVIAAPGPGVPVQVQPLAGWWQSNLDAVLRP